MAAKGCNLKKATKYIFGPLVDAPPAHPDTVLTMLHTLEDVTKQHRQTYLYMVCDLQLFKIAIQIQWADPLRWRHLVLRPGGMHTLMSFLGSIGTLMKGSGLEDLLHAAYKGVPNMLNGKAWPKALRGFRMVLTVILETFILKGSTALEDLEGVLEQARQSPTGRVWVDCFIIPVVIAHLFIRAEREGNWLLHQHCIQRMIPYMMAAGHWNYARYLSWYVQREVDEEAELPFQLGEHVCRHRDGVWNGVSTDMFGEQTYIRKGKAKGGLVGISTSEEQVAGWVLSYHICQMVSTAMDTLCNEDENRSDDDYEEKNDKHKEEGDRRKELDAHDRNKIREELQKSTHPLTLESSDLVNIANGCVAGSEVNVQEAVVIGEQMSATFTASLPAGFYKPLRTKLVTMETSKKGNILHNVESIFTL